MSEAEVSRSLVFSFHLRNLRNLRIILLLRSSYSCRSRGQRESRPRTRERLSGELLGLTRGCDLRKEGVTVTYSGKQS